MASSEDTLRSPESCRPSRSVVTRSSGESIPLFMQVGVVRMRPSQSRTDKLPSQATIYPCWYIQRPATQMSRACCASLFACPGKSESGVKGRLLPGGENPPHRLVQVASGTLLLNIRNRPTTTLGLYRAHT